MPLLSLPPLPAPHYNHLQPEKLLEEVEVERVNRLWASMLSMLMSLLALGAFCLLRAPQPPGTVLNRMNCAPLIFLLLALYNMYRLIVSTAQLCIMHFLALRR